MRAIEPDRSGTLTIAGFEVAWEMFGDPEAPPLLMLPAWQIAPGLVWKMQVPVFAKYFRVITIDPPGIGKGERTTDRAAFLMDTMIDYCLGLLDHFNIDRAPIVGYSIGGAVGLWMAARHPERVERAVLIGTSPGDFARSPGPEFYAERESYEGWEKWNANYWQTNYRGWLEFFFGEICSEPHSSKIFDDHCEWALETTPEILIASILDRGRVPEDLPFREAVLAVQCPVLLIHGDDDRVVPIRISEMMAELRPDFDYLKIAGGSHAPQARQPVRVNQEILRFLGVQPPAGGIWQTGWSRDTRRALFISSPIGLGHVQRDLAIARELRELVPGLEIDWLAQSPVTMVLEQAGEQIHPLSNALASESAHWEHSAGDHRLHAFQTFREMDEILLANFDVFLDAVNRTPYDLWIGDEAWDVDHYLHENPELKRAPYVFMTDFLGWLPIDRSEGSREAWLTADYNRQMIGQVERYRRIRDLALYIGDYDDLIPECFGPGLPSIPEWTREHFTATGYVLPFDPQDIPTRSELGYAPDRPLVIFTVGGTSVGRSLLKQVIAGWPLVLDALPDAQGLVVTGPRMNPETFEAQPNLAVTGYVHNLHRHLSVADVAVVQGGLSTTMELTAARRPFIYVPLRDHFEQLFHVSHRLSRYQAGLRMEYDDLTPESLAAGILSLHGSDTACYRQIEPGAARRAAEQIAPLL